jgi:hypothetical protein
MLDIDEIRRSLAAIIAGRIADGGEGPVENEAYVLAQYSGLSEETARALLAAEPISLDEFALAHLSGALYLHPGLIGCLLSPLAPSHEVVRHVLRQVRGRHLNPECSDCSALAQQVDAICSGSLDGWERLALNLLAHVNATPDGMEDEEDEVFVDRLTETVFALPPDLREEVLAFAIYKRQEAEGRSFNDFAALGRFRALFLSPLARQTFDAIALSQRGQLTVRELVAEMKLPDARSLGQLSRSIVKAVADLNKSGMQLPENPFLVSGRGSSRVFRLAPKTLNAWRALARAQTGEEEAVLAGLDWDPQDQ